MTQVRISDADPTPPYEQLRRQLAGLILRGELAAGDRLPPVRQLAGDLGLAAGTVARAYRELDAEGLVMGRRGGGTVVADGQVGPGATADSADVRRAAEALARLARGGGLSLDQARVALDAAWQDVQ